MTTYGSKLYSTFVYGILSSISSISPDSGPSVGGQNFVINGVGMDPRMHDDEFTGVGLDLLKWTDISSGSGSLSTGATHLQLTTGVTASSIAGIESISGWNDCQLEVRAMLPRVVAHPAGDVSPIAFQLRVDANNYALMKIDLDTNGVYTLKCEVYRGGSLVGSYSQVCTRGLSNMRILRWGTTVYFIYQGVLVYYNADFITTGAKARVYADNQSETYDVTSTVEWFYWRTYVVFENEVVYAPTIVSDTRLRGLTPPSTNDKAVSAAYAGLVDVTVVGVTSITSTDAYEYYYRDRLRILNAPQTDALLSIIDDDQLITKNTLDKGL